MRVLVTGSSGHLGEALFATLRASGHEVVGLDVAPSVTTTVIGSVTDHVVVARAMRGVDAVLHTATLHKPHVATHSRRSFVDTNVTGTLVMLEAAAAAGVRSFVFTSTTSAFGRALTPGPDEPAAWITEDIHPLPRNIYGATKVAAEDLCELVHRDEGMPCVILRTARFFPEPDDNPAIRTRFPTANAQVNELLYRRVDLADVVSAHVLAIDRAADIGLGRFIISATTPFTPAETAALRQDAGAVVWQHFPDARATYDRLGWRMFPVIDRIYDNGRARMTLGWTPRYDFTAALQRVSVGEDPRSDLAVSIGEKGYHRTSVL
jgi:nucleoside-diphosphate-sugar epimerase